MKLGIKDRISLLTILPQQGDFVTLTIKQDLVEKIKITQEEIKELEIKSENGSTFWNPKKEVEMELEFTELEEKLVKDSLEGLNTKKSLNDDTFNLYKKFNA